MEEKITIIKEILDDIRPYLNLEGGDIEFIKYEDNYLYVKLFGACSNCGYQDYTLNDNLLMLIKERIPDIEGVINVEI
ncbi:MAG: NifU family protein [Bacilli bacterium]|nr:NifU family protein [Bacilli bacterium]